MPLKKDMVAEAIASAGIAGASGPVTRDSVAWVAACDDYASVKLTLPDSATPGEMDAIADAAYGAVREAAKRDGGSVSSLTVMFVRPDGSLAHQRRFTPGQDQGSPQGQTREAGPSKPAPGDQPKQEEQSGHRPIPGLAQGSLPGVKHAIAVGAGKGGVGKSTIAVNLAVGLARKGHAVGLLDGDIYGPSLPTMLGLRSLEQNVHEGRLQPFPVHGVKAITIGKLVDAEKPLIWRGPMAHGAFKQLVEQASWGELDYLIIDLPPGTGDVPLTMAQTLQLTGAVIVCTPQRVAQDDALRAVRMFQQLNIDILGVVENMSEFMGDDGKRYDIFGRGGAEQMASRLSVPFLGAVPITMALRANSDEGDPSANFAEGDGPQAGLRGALESLVDAMERQASVAAVRHGKSAPKLSIS